MPDNLEAKAKPIEISANPISWITAPVKLWYRGWKGIINTGKQAADLYGDITSAIKDAKEYDAIVQASKEHGYVPEEWRAISKRAKQTGLSMADNPTAKRDHRQGIESFAKERGMPIHEATELFIQAKRYGQSPRAYYNAYQKQVSEEAAEARENKLLAILSAYGPQAAAAAASRRKGTPYVPVILIGVLSAIILFLPQKITGNAIAEMSPGFKGIATAIIFLFILIVVYFWIRQIKIKQKKLKELLSKVKKTSKKK